MTRTPDMIVTADPDSIDAGPAGAVRIVGTGTGLGRLVAAMCGGEAAIRWHDAPLVRIRPAATQSTTRPTQPTQPTAPPSGTRPRTAAQFLDAIRHVATKRRASADGESADECANGGIRRANNTRNSREGKARE